MWHDQTTFVLGNDGCRLSGDLETECMFSKAFTNEAFLRASHCQVWHNETGKSRYCDAEGSAFSVWMLDTWIKTSIL